MNDNDHPQLADDSTWHCIRSSFTGQLLTFNRRHGTGPVLVYRSSEEAAGSLAALTAAEPHMLWAIEPLPADSFMDALGKPTVAQDGERRQVASSFTLDSPNGERFTLHLTGDVDARTPFAFDELRTMVEIFLGQIRGTHPVTSTHHVYITAQEPV